MVRGTVVRNVDGRRVSMEVTMDQPIETFIVNTLNRLSAEELAGAKSPAPGSGVHVMPITKSGVSCGSAAHDRKPPCRAPRRPGHCWCSATA